MAKGKARTVAVRLISAAGTGFFYTLFRPRGKEKLTLRKFDPRVNQHVLFKESKQK